MKKRRWILVSVTVVSLIVLVSVAGALAKDRWNGWSVNRIPRIRGGLEAIIEIDSKNVWAIGGSERGPLALRWNGRAWKRYATNLGGSASLMGIFGLSSGDVWAVG